MRLAIPGAACPLVLAGHLALAQQPPPVLPDGMTLFDAVMDEIEADSWYAEHAAMIRAESGWSVHAESPYAQGWSQFTPPTRGDWWKKIPGCEDADPFDPRCNMPWRWTCTCATCTAGRLPWSTRHDSRPGDGKTIAYNGGLGWQIREHRLCLATPGCDPDSWQHLARLCMEAGRSEAACRENSEYPLKIQRAEPKYRKRKKGWKRKLLKGVAIGASVAQGRVPEIR